MRTVVSRWFLVAASALEAMDEPSEAPRRPPPPRDDRADNRRPKVIAHADRLAQAVALDMAAVGWRPTVDNYLGRITKGCILQAIIGLMMVTAKAQLPPGEAIQLASSAELEGQG